MKLHTAYRLAIGAMENEIKLLNMDANLHDDYHARYPRAITASKQRKKLLMAIELLQAEIKGKNERTGQLNLNLDR